jgi:hypothetical protein
MPALMVSGAGSGLSTSESFATFDREQLLWRTWQTSLFGGLTEFSGDWPRAGMTRNGNAYRLEPLVPFIREIESLCWLSTPTATMTVRSEQARDSGRKPQPMEVCKGKIPSGYRGEIPPDPTGEAIGPMNPQWGEWLMGFPVGWTDCTDSATPLFPKSPNGSDGGS